ncbi:MAG: DUF885 domain-containing protein [Acidimicrobiales bacterium]
MPDPTLRQLADDYWETYISANPTSATLLGDRRFDDQIEDISVETEQRRRATYSGYLERLATIDEAGLDQGDRVTHQMLAEELGGHVRLIDARVWEMRWDHQEGVAIGMLSVAPEITAPTPESAAALVERLRKFPGLLDQAVDRHRHGLANGRTPQAIVLERAANSIANYLASPLETDSFVTMAGPSGWDSEAAWREDLIGVTRDAVRPALQRYHDVLTTELAAVARPNDRCGLKWIDGGGDLYRTLIRWHVGPDLDPEEIHRIGLAELNEKLPAEYAEIGRRLFGVDDVEEVFARIRADRAMYYQSAQEILDDVKVTLEAGQAAMGDWFGRLPKTDCEVKEVPEHLAPDAPGAYYYSPAADGSRPGAYFVNTYEPETKTRYETASVAAHEAIPGHHLQLAISIELDNLPKFQRFSERHSAFVEGWGLYAERLGDEMGLYRSDVDRVGMLMADSFRSCRLVVDTGLHELGWSREQAIEFMVTNSPVPREEVVSEIDRYIAMPAQALSYKLGQLEILRLRRGAEQRLGDRFDIKGFHDTVLGSATISLPVLGYLVDAWVTT